MLAGAKNLKDTVCSIREGFSLATRQSSRSLIEFAKQRNRPLKLAIEKFRIDNSTYINESSSNVVVQSAK